MPPPVRARAPQAKNTAHSRQKVAKSLQEVYDDACRESNVHPNSAFYKLLPDRPTAPIPGESLDLRRNYVGDKGMVPVLAVVQLSQHLKKLDLTENGLRNAAVERLSAVVAKHKGITSINLSDNYISDGAAKALETLLKENNRIVDLTLVNTKIDAEARLRLKTLCGQNQSTQAALAASAPSPTAQAAK